MYQLNRELDIVKNHFNKWFFVAKFCSELMH